MHSLRFDDSSPQTPAHLVALAEDMRFGSRPSEKNKSARQSQSRQSTFPFWLGFSFQLIHRLVRYFGGKRRRAPEKKWKRFRRFDDAHPTCLSGLFLRILNRSLLKSESLFHSLFWGAVNLSGWLSHVAVCVVHLVSIQVGVDSLKNLEINRLKANP